MKKKNDSANKSLISVFCALLCNSEELLGFSLVCLPITCKRIQSEKINTAIYVLFNLKLC